MEEKSTNENRCITKIQASDNECYFLNATYLNGEPVNNYKIDGQSIFNSNSGDISIFRKYNSKSSLSQMTPLEPNTKYIFTSDITSSNLLNFEDVVWNNEGYGYCEYTFIFKCGENNAPITESDDGWYWADGVKPALEENMRYELSISVIKISNENIVHAILVPFIK